MLLYYWCSVYFCYGFGSTSVDISNKVYVNFHGMGIELFTTKCIHIVWTWAKKPVSWKSGKIYAFSQLHF